MDIETYLAAYRKFDAEFCPDAEDIDIKEKVIEEYNEWLAEWFCGRCPENEKAEAIDLMNLAIKLVTKVYGVKDPLHAGFAKLELTAEKYRSRKEAQ